MYKTKSSLTIKFSDSYYLYTVDIQEKNVAIKLNFK